MHVRSILAIARKDAIDIILNRGTLFGLLTPIFLAFMFLGISSVVGAKTSNILVYDPGNAGIDQVVTSFFDHPSVTRAGSPDDVTAAFGPNGVHKSSPYAVGLVVPANFEAELRKGNHPQLGLYVNGDEVNNLDRQLLMRVISSYASAVTNPQPLKVTVATINPPTSTPTVDLSSFYIVAALLISLLVGTSLVPNLLIEEKEKKTMRMLMVSPATFTDIVLGKLLVGLVYQIVLAVVVIAVQKGFVGNIPMMLLFVLLGSCFALALGLLAGSIFETTGALGGFISIVSILFTVSTFFTGPLGTLLGSNPVAQLIRILPSYYVADGAFNALQNQSALPSVLFDGGIVLSCTIVVLGIALWLLRRQASVVAAI
ncbi:MAG TPA: ABC transporter permease [Ktedonobacteraceae bacterium]|nr:ABC transporter permease [Ktedonobacteraceae bacterium]